MYTTGTHKEIGTYCVDSFCGHCNTVFEATGCFFIVRYVNMLLLPSLEKIRRGNKKRELDNQRKQYMEEKGYNVIEINEIGCWKMYKTEINVKQHLCESFFYKKPPREERLLEIIKSGSLFVYVQCDIEVPENLREAFANFPPIFKNNNVGRDDIGPFKNEYAQKEVLLTQPRKMLKSSFFLVKGTNITTVQLIYLGLGLVCRIFFALCNTLQRSASTTFFSQQ